jgi:hypothetical protein
VSLEGMIKSIEKPSDLVENRTCNLPACSRVPQQTTVFWKCIGLGMVLGLLGGWEEYICFD